MIFWPAKWPLCNPNCIQIKNSFPWETLFIWFPTFIPDPMRHQIPLLDQSNNLWMLTRFHSKMSKNNKLSYVGKWKLDFRILFRDVPDFIIPGWCCTQPLRGRRPRRGGRSSCPRWSPQWRSWSLWCCCRGKWRRIPLPRTRLSTRKCAWNLKM